MDREFAQLRKTSRKKDNQIKSLLSDARHRDIVLKRRQEEVQYTSMCTYICMSYNTCSNIAALCLSVS